MGLLDGLSQEEYYQGSDLGNYQFVSLNDIITQFQVMYVGEDKIIPKAKKADIAFHAQRALAELSFDTFKSFKSQQIEVPPSLVMALPHDYVNYTKVSRVDRVGIKHPLYPTRHTSNPFQVHQNSDGVYQFATDVSLLQNGTFDSGLDFFQHTSDITISDVTSQVLVEDGVLKFKHKSHELFHGNIGNGGVVLAIWQEINVSGINIISISAKGHSETVTNPVSTSPTLRVGVSANPGDYNAAPFDLGGVGIVPFTPASTNVSTESFIENSYLEWNQPDGQVTKTLDVNVTEYETVYLLVTSFADFTFTNSLASSNSTVDDLTVTANVNTHDLEANPGNDINSSTWNNFKTADSITVDIDDYRYPDVYLDGPERYGLNPEHAQVNGDFYIDQRLGRIHFSSNINGKTVILDYISDSLGTDEEMKVPKLAEEAMYKHILYDVVSTRSDVGAGRLAFHKREKFAAVRKAKLRLSNIKLEELTQILRGQSKHIKH